MADLVSPEYFEPGWEASAKFMGMELLKELEENVIPAFAGLDLARPELAATTLAERLPLDGELMQRIRRLVDAAVDDASLLPKENMGVRYGRLAKNCAGYSIDAVEMDGPGPKHAHPNGEIDLCFASEGSPEFCGHAAGWSVFAPGSVHVPTVRGGRMRILYFLPGGAIDFSLS